MSVGLLYAALPVFAAYCVVLWFYGRWDAGAGTFFGGLIGLFILNFFLHRALCVTGKIAWYVLPLLWTACLLPLYYASHHWIRPSFFGPDFTFQTLAIFMLAPLVLFSLALGIVFALKRGAG